MAHNAAWDMVGWEGSTGPFVGCNLKRLRIWTAINAVLWRNQPSYWAFEGQPLNLDTALICLGGLSSRFSARKSNSSFPSYLHFKLQHMTEPSSVKFVMEQQTGGTNAVTREAKWPVWSSAHCWGSVGIWWSGDAGNKVDFSRHDQLHVSLRCCRCFFSHRDS